MVAFDSPCKLWPKIIMPKFLYTFDWRTDSILKAQIIDTTKDWDLL